MAKATVSHGERNLGVAAYLLTKMSFPKAWASNQEDHPSPVLVSKPLHPLLSHINPGSVQAGPHGFQAWADSQEYWASVALMG